MKGYHDEFPLLQLAGLYASDVRGDGIDALVHFTVELDIC